MEDKTKGFLFGKEAKESKRKYLGGYVILAKYYKAGDKIELIAHKAEKLTKDGQPFFYVFERDELEADGAPKKVAAKVAVKDDGDIPF